MNVHPLPGGNVKTELEERLKQEAQIQAQEARSHRATVREIYQAVTGRTGEPGDWNGAIPVLALIEERDALSAQVREIPDLLTIAHMQGSEQAKDRVAELTAERDRYREALRKLLPEQDPLDAEIVCDYCGASVPWDEAQNEHKEDCPWLMAYWTKDPK